MRLKFFMLFILPIIVNVKSEADPPDVQLQTADRTDIYRDPEERYWRVPEYQWTLRPIHNVPRPIPKPIIMNTWEIKDATTQPPPATTELVYEDPITPKEYIVTGRPNPFNPQRPLPARPIPRPITTPHTTLPTQPPILEPIPTDIYIPEPQPEPIPARKPYPSYPNRPLPPRPIPRPSNPPHISLPTQPPIPEPTPTDIYIPEPQPDPIPAPKPYPSFPNRPLPPRPIRRPTNPPHISLPTQPPMPAPTPTEMYIPEPQPNPIPVPKPNPSYPIRPLPERPIPRPVPHGTIEVPLPKPPSRHPMPSRPIPRPTHVGEIVVPLPEPQPDPTPEPTLEPIPRPNPNPPEPTPEVIPNNEWQDEWQEPQPIPQPVLVPTTSRPPNRHTLPPRTPPPKPAIVVPYPKPTEHVVPPTQATVLPKPTPRPTQKPVQQKPPKALLDNSQVLYDYQCGAANGYYSLANECDTYIECTKYAAIKYLCPDGLHFNPKALWPEYPCAYPSEVKCESRAIIQDPRPTVECPRQYGFFSLSDGDCGKYMMCQEGMAIIMNCPPGLAFNFDKSSCDWPENVPSCNPSVFYGYTCPAPPMDEDGRPSDLIYKYRYGKSCKQYVACQRGHPRLLSCDIGLAFDEVSESCIDTDYVRNCELVW